MINFNLSPLISLSATGGVPTALTAGMRLAIATIGSNQAIVCADNTVRGLGHAQADVAINTAATAAVAAYTYSPGTRAAILTVGPVTFGNTLYAAALGAVAPTGTVVVGTSLTTSANVSDTILYLAASAIT